MSTDKTEYRCDDIAFSSSLAKGGGLFAINVLQEGEFKGLLIQGSSLVALRNSLSSQPIAGQGILRIYSSADTNVKGQNCLDKSQSDVDNVNFDISLKRGWNLLTMDLATDKTFKLVNTTSLEGINWYFLEQMNF